MVSQSINANGTIKKTSNAISCLLHLRCFTQNLTSTFKPPQPPPAKKGRRSILDVEPMVQSECQMDELKSKIKDLTEELIDVRGQKVEMEKVGNLVVNGVFTCVLARL